MSDNRKKLARQLQRLTGASYVTCLQALRAKMLRLEEAQHEAPMRACQEAAEHGDHLFFGLRRGGDAPP